MGDTTEQTLKIVGGFLLVVVFTLAYVLGQNAQTRTQRNMQSRLELTRQRFQNCDTERRMLSGGIKGKEYDELKIAEQDHQALVSENQLLNEDNQQLRQDNYALEEQIDELRDELDDKDFVSDDEVEQLEDAMSFGNNSAELKEFLDDAQILGGINKDTLITKLMAELKHKRENLRKCRAKKGVPGPKIKDDGTLVLVDEPEPKKEAEPLLWDDMDEAAQKAELKKAVARIAAVRMENSTAATTLMKKWAKRYPGGIEELRGAVTKAIKKMVSDNEEPEEGAAKKKAKKAEEAEEEEEAPKKKVKKAVAEDEEAEVEPPKKKKAVAVAEEEEEETPKKSKKVKVLDEDEDQPAPKKKAKKAVAVDEDEEAAAPEKPKVPAVEDDEDEAPAPKKKKRVVAADE